MPPALSRRHALLLFSIVILTWGLNWVVTKTIVGSVPPLWTSAIRSGVACAVLLLLQLVRRDFVVPARGDIPVVLAIGLLHMVGFSTLVAIGLRHIAVGRSIVLGYTTPLWVAPLAWILLGETQSRRGLLGIGLAFTGLVVMFNPAAIDWHDRSAMIGNGLILLASWCWAASILYVRKHRWIATPFQLVFWEALLAGSVLGVLAMILDGPPNFTWTPALVAAFAYAGVCGTALGYWAMAMINRSLPATTTALGMLLTPIAGITGSAIFLDERPDGMLLGATALILLGIALGTAKGTAGNNAPSQR
jgi:drug/metabolite transporter (DMT)-like permease